MQEQLKSAGLSRGIGVLPIWRANGFYLQIFSKLSMTYNGGRVVSLGDRKAKKTRRGGRVNCLRSDMQA